MTIQISAFSQKHLPAITSLLNEEYKGSNEFIPFSEERVLSHIRKHGLRILVAEEESKTVGLIGTHPEEHAEVSIHWLAAQEQNDKATIENTLINKVEKDAPGDTVSTMIDEGSPKIIDWIKRGYTLMPGFQRMSARLSGLKPIPEVAQDIKLRSLRPDEEEKLVTMMNTGFGWERLELGAIETWKTEDPPFNEEWVQIAEIDDKIISAVVARPDSDYMKYFNRRRGYLGPAATLPEFRNKHLASALTARAMNFLFEKGMDSVRLGTSEQNISSIALLRSLGFDVDMVRKILRKKLKTG